MITFPEDSGVRHRRAIKQVSRVDVGLWRRRVTADGSVRALGGTAGRESGRRR